ncbi:hypothetical protein ACFLRB_01210 [Acidobacteriota bacterium]
MVKRTLLLKFFHSFTIFFFVLLFVRANPEDIEDLQKSLDFANRAVEQAEKIKLPQEKAKVFLSIADNFKY